MLGYHKLCVRYTQSTITFALRSLTNGGWVSLGFSKGGNKPMIGSSAIIGWVDKEKAFIDDFYLFNQTSVGPQVGRKYMGWDAIHVYVMRCDAICVMWSCVHLRPVECDDIYM